ncbi:hypothetical protein [Leptothoe kymatousa]|uniref:Uncharacterized protein n=1 Tax=Leptothoe kymatousa TAU-MAC 1615 TaxID=2364775 RepID=A0ABS5Y681_9CYAN|nr:hypothetical protein [Leptothoe kymatousa]MBT9312475.1 hypothetical protein [Leptothoe kymatousa TAU-MAC 1615]
MANWKTIGMEYGQQRCPLVRGTNGGVFDHLRKGSSPLPDGSPWQGCRIYTSRTKAQNPALAPIWGI